MAAYSAVRMGKSVILIDPGKHIGGLTSGGLGYTDIGNKYAITGLSRDFYRRAGRHYGRLEQWIFEPHVAENIFKAYLKAARVNLVQEVRLVQVLKIGTEIKQATFRRSSGKEKELRVSARVFMDCTYEGDLMAMAGVSYTVGREANATYGETYNGVQLMKGHQFPDGVDPYKVKGDPSSGLLWGISNAALRPNGTGDTLVQAYNYRICLTSDPANRIPITRPEGYDSTRYDLLVRLMEAQPQKRQLNDYFIWSRMPNHKTDINNRNGFSTDFIGANYAYPKGDETTRKRYIADLTAYTQGLLYFFGHDSRVPDTLRAQMREWGYPKDEYREYGHWSPQPYIREARRMVGAYVMTEVNCTGKEVADDGVGLAAYTMDSHNTQRIVWNGMVKNEGNVEIGGFGPYPISYRALLPKEAECSNLLVPVCLSASHIAYGSIRMEPVFMVLAQSAAVAANLSIDKNVPLHQVVAAEINGMLKKDPLLDGRPPEVLVDNEDSGFSKSGNWQAYPNQGYGKSLLVADASAGERPSARFYPSLSADQDFDVYYYFTQVKDFSPEIRLNVFDGRKVHPVTVNAAKIQVLGQTTGEWVRLGTFRMKKSAKPYVEIAAGGIGHTIADAVLFLPKQ